MKNFLKIFFTALCLFIPTFASASGINQITSEVNSIPVVSAVSKLNSETSIAAVNTGNLELSAIQDRRNNQSFGNIDKSNAQNKLIQQIFTAYYNKLFYSTSHKISSYLKNEICTRAP